ncbi:cyclic GMP-AMP synthase [Pseudorasbora parva]|uniref:cyclic GMP-AMP synthase n=1 Tax=Pseudorasbora parva TaxID=51549 RepID=UPI00351DD042
MSSQRRQNSVRVTSPDRPRPKAKASVKPSGKSKEQRDRHASGIENKSPERTEEKGAQKRGSRTRQSKTKENPHEYESQEKHRETPAPNRQNITHRDLSNGDGQSLEISESKENLGAACRRRAVSGDNDRRDSAKSKRQSKKTTNPHDYESEGKSQQPAKSKSGEKTAPKRQSKKERDPPNLDREESLESKSEEKPTHFSDTHPALSARSSDRKKKSVDKTALRELSVDDTLGKVLKGTIDKLKIKKCQRSTASSCVNDITVEVIAHLKKYTTWCADIERLPTGSYYENVKICEPDEFDVMLTIPVERVDIDPFDEAGAFYSVALKRHPNKHPLDIFLNEDKTIQASKMLSEFRDAVKEAVENLQCRYKIEIQRKKPRCPAVTLEVSENKNIISIDFVLGLKVHRASWPVFTKDGFKIENWLGKKEKADMKRQPFYLVPKYVGKGDAEHDGVVAKDAWRISFSHVEKEILKRHGQSKTCCEAGGQKCCRKECLKLLKYLLQRLKEDNSKSNKMSKFCSYHAKTTLLHACAARGNDNKWAYSQLADCFQQLSEDFVKYLKARHLPNFFIPSHNLLDQATPISCDFLANAIEFQCNNYFPIFSKL